MRFFKERSNFYAMLNLLSIYFFKTGYKLFMNKKNLMILPGRKIVLQTLCV